MSQTAKSPDMRVMRSQLGRVRGMGAAKSGTGHWWAQRLTALALLPLTLWFVWAALHLSGMPRAAVAHWAGNPINAALLVALVVVTFHHLLLGLQVVIEDYIHSEAARTVSLVVLRGVVWLVALIGVLAALKLAIAG
ncbi:MAG TPA: succinate dehydrogenase, hydrophobic membrane anchor protein [Acetobacteraceae bacterium]|nr:succinate dehydrogenase, hydrophobic membrane anchor protein [Acetobacteraceae bacterium]